MPRKVSDQGISRSAMPSSAGAMPTDAMVCTTPITRGDDAECPHRIAHFGERVRRNFAFLVMGFYFRYPSDFRFRMR